MSKQQNLKRRLLDDDQVQVNYGSSINTNEDHQPLVRKHSMDFHRFGKKFICVGMNYECKVFKQLNQLIEFIRKSSRNRRAQRDQFDDEDDEEEDYQEILEYGDPVWIDVQSASDSDLKRMEEVFHIHPLTIEDCQYNNSAEKWEVYDHYMHVVFVGQVDDEIFDSQIEHQYHVVHTPMGVHNECMLHILVFHNYVITIHERPIKGLNLIMRRIETEFELDIVHQSAQSNVRSYKYDFGRALEKTTVRPQHKKRTHIPSPDWILYAFLDVLVDMYIPFVDSMVIECDTLDEMIYILKRNESRDLLRRLGMSKRNNITLKRLLIPKYAMTQVMISEENEFITENVQLYMRDVLDHLQMCIEKLEIARKNLNQTQTSYVTKFQLDVARDGDKTHTTINQITLFATIWAPLSLISGVWGMNVAVPTVMEHKNLTFYMIIGWMLLLTVSMVLFFNHMGLLGVKKRRRLLKK